MNKYKRSFVASSEIFSGYKVDIDIRRIETLEEILTSNNDELFYVCNHCNVNSELEVTIL